MGCDYRFIGKTFFVCAALCGLFLLALAHANWTGPTDAKLHAWFDQLASGKGLCCSFADGLALDDPDWGMESVAGADGKSQVIVYWVKIEGQKIDVPPEALVTEPNKFGRAVVWPLRDSGGHWTVRCFMPGVEG